MIDTSTTAGSSSSSGGMATVACEDGLPVPGELCFGPAMPMGTGMGPVAVTVVDLNNDGHLDIISANQTSNNLTVRTGKGTGLFNALSALSAGTGPYALAAPDINNDGAPDLVAANFGSANLSLYQNNGLGNLIVQPPIAAGGQPRALALAHVNKDDFDDIFVANFMANTVGVYLGDGIGDLHRPRKPPGDRGQQRRVVTQTHRHRAREREHPLPITHRRQHVVHQQRRALGHPPAHARGTAADSPSAPPPMTLSAFGMNLHAATTADGRDRKRSPTVCSPPCRAPG